MSGCRTAVNRHAKARHVARLAMMLAVGGAMELFAHDARAQSPLDWVWDCSGGWFPNGACTCVGPFLNCPNITFRPTIDFKSTASGVICSTTGSCTDITPLNLDCAQLTLSGPTIYLSTSGTVVGPILVDASVSQVSGANVFAHSLLVYGGPAGGTWMTNGGIVSVSGDASIGALGGSLLRLSVASGQLSVGGTLRLFEPTSLSGGTLSVGGMTGCNFFDWTGGTLRFTNPVTSLDGSNCLASTTLSGTRVLEAVEGLVVPVGSHVSVLGGGLRSFWLIFEDDSVLSSGSIDVAQNEHVGFWGTATLTQTGGTNTIGSRLFMGNTPGSHGTYDLRGGSLNAFIETLGEGGGNATFVQSGTSTNTTALLYIQGAETSYTLTSGTLTVDQTPAFTVGELIGAGVGTGRFIQTGGTHTVTSDFWLSHDPGSVGYFTLSGGTLNVGPGNLVVGAGTLGSFMQTGGVATINSFMFLGLAAGSTGIYTMHDGELHVGDIRTDHGNGTFTMDGGTVTFNDHWIRAGISPGSIANYTFTGGTVTNATSGLILAGESGTGTLNFGGTAVITNNAPGNDLIFGVAEVGNGTVRVSGSATLNVWDIRTDSGHGTFEQDGGTVNVGGWLVLGNYPTGVSSYTLRNGTANLSLMARVGNLGTGTLGISGGHMSIAQDLTIGLGAGRGTVNLSDSGILSVVGNEFVGVNGTAVFSQTGGTHTVTNALTVAANAGSVGTYHLSGGSLSAGSIAINLGGLFDLEGPSPTTTLSTPLITNSGIFSVGGSSGTSLASTNFNQTSRGILDVRIDGTAPGQYGQLAIQHANLAGTLSISLGSGYVPAVGDTFDIITGPAGSVAGTFANTDLPCGWIVRYGTNYVRVSCASTTFSCPYDVTTSFSTAFNPRGPWSYCVGGQPITTMLPATTGPIGPGWGYNPSFDGSITRARLNDATAFDWRAGDVMFNTLSPSLGGTATNFNSIRWTSPSAGAIVITGTAWDAQFAAGRDAMWNLVVNGTTIASRSSVFGVHRADSTASFANNLLPGRSLANIPVLPGQVVELQALTTPGSEYGHFMGVTMQITFCHGGAGVSGGPNPTIACMGGTTSFEVMSQGTGVTTRWQVELPPVGSNSWVDLADGPVPIPGSLTTAGGTASTTLLLTNADPPAGTRYRCRVSNNCGTVLSSPADLTVCVADTDDGSGTGVCDGGVTIDDLLYYLQVFEAGGLRADVDDGSGSGSRDGGVTIDDLLYYLFRFEQGC